jgi:hypothetical protein
MRPTREVEVEEYGHEVTITVEGPTYVQVADGYLLPRDFTARGLQIVGEPLRVDALRVRVGDDGRPACRSLTVSPVDEDAAVTTVLLRRLKMAELLEIACAAAAERFRRDAAGRVVEAPMSGADMEHFRSDFAARVRRPRRGKPLTDDQLRKVAEVWRDAAARGSRRPTLDVARRLYVARSTAGRWIAEARRRGILAPPQKKEA